MTTEDRARRARVAFDEAYDRNDVEAAEQALVEMSLALWEQSGAVTDAALMLQIMRGRLRRASSPPDDPAHETGEG